MSADTAYGLTLVAACVAAMAVGALVTTRSRVAWGIVVLVAFVIARILLPPSAPEIVRVGALLAAVVFWFSARSAMRAGRTIHFAERAAAALALVLASVFALRLEIRLKQDASRFAARHCRNGGTFAQDRGRSGVAWHHAGNADRAHWTARRVVTGLDLRA